MEIVATIGLDIAKRVFQVHGADKSGRSALRCKLGRNEVARFALLRSKPAEVCIIGHG